MPNEEFTQNDNALSENNALSEKELEGVSGGELWTIVMQSGEPVGVPVVCPACGSRNVAPDPEGGCQCLDCKVKFGQSRYQTYKYS